MSSILRTLAKTRKGLFLTLETLTHSYIQTINLLPRNHQLRWLFKLVHDLNPRYWFNSYLHLSSYFKPYPPRYRFDRYIIFISLRLNRINNNLVSLWFSLVN